MLPFDGTAVVNGAELAYLELGSGPLALCLHGYPDTARTWRHLMPQLADAGFRVVAPYLRGYAPSGLAPDGRYQSGVLGLDANALHDHFGGGGDAVIIGHDWGATATYAASVLEPDRWRRVTTLAVPPAMAIGMGFLEVAQLKRSWYTFFQLTELAEFVLPLDDWAFIRALWADWSPGYDASADVADFIEAMATPEHLAAALGNYRQTIQSEHQDPALAGAQTAALSLPTQPLLFLHGRDDGCFGAGLAEQTAAHLSVPGSRMVVFDDVGHFLHLEQPGIVNDAIIGFVTETSQSA